MVLTILTEPSPVLLEPCQDAVPGPELSMLLHSMIETLRATPNALGLAAPQVGVSVRAFVLGTEEQGYLAVVNPRITKRSGVRVANTETCLSAPGRSVKVHRPYSVTIKATNAEGAPCEFTCKGLAAATVCHEIDHLDGKLI